MQYHGLARVAGSKLLGRARSETGESEMSLLLQKVWKSLGRSHLKEVVGQLVGDELVSLADLLAHLQPISINLVRNISIIIIAMIWRFWD